MSNILSNGWMPPTFLVWLLLTFLYPSRANTTTVHRGYVFTAPKRLLTGETETGCLSLHNLEPPAHIALELLSPTSAVEEEILASTSNVVKSGVETCLELSVPATKYTNGRLRLKMRFDKHPHYTVNAVKEVYIEHDSLITFVETDKPVYKPGQDVKIRILMLKHDLKPWKYPIPKVWIENPSEVRVAQWINVSTENGMAQLNFPLSPEPNSGIWKIKLEKKRSQPLQPAMHTSMFEVKKYVLPRFELTIRSPGYILADAENVTWNICAKYSYGKPVKGTLLLKSTPQTPSWRRKLNLPEIHYETELDSPDGCTEFVLSGAVLGLAHWKVAPNNIVLIANFTEAGTGIVETTISKTVVVHQALKLEFTPYTPKYFKLGLPYHGKLRVLRQDDVPAANEKIQLCLKVRGKDEWLRVVVECRNFTSSADGFVDFVVPPAHKNIVLLSFVATGIDYPTKYYSPDKRWRVFMDQPSAYVDVNPWYSPSDSYLAVARGYQPILCGEKYSFNVMYTVPANNESNEPIAFHYSINSKGDLLIYGHVKHKPSRDTVLNYSEFRNLLGVVESSTNKTEQGTVVHRFPLSVKVTPSMAPVSELLLYYVRADGETVATTYTIEVGHCFDNKVKTAWHTDAQPPGTATQYHVEAAPWSLCGISVVDKSTLFLAGAKSKLIDAEQTFDKLKRFHPDPETRPIWTWTHCKAPAQPDVSTDEFDHLPSPAMEASPRGAQKKKRRSIVYNGGVNYVDAIQAFDDFGAIVISDLILETRPCPQFLLDRGPSSWISFAFDRHMMHSKIDESDKMFKAVKTMPVAFPLLNFAPEMGYVDQLPDQMATLRSYFPETWLWELVATGKDGKVTIDRTIPDTITDWVGHTVCISPSHGLGIAPPTTVTAFQPFFLDYSLPYSVKRGEMLRMKVSLFNYMQHSLPVEIKLEEATGLDLHLSHPAASFCVKPRDSVVYEYVLRPRVLGDVNITVSAAIDPDYAEPCGPETLLYTRDVIVKPILVLPEGFPVESTRSALVCPKNFSDDSMIEWKLDIPDDLIAESAKAYVTLVGDILGPALDNLENLIRLPMGCGEQNMILFVPNIHVIGYLDAIGTENTELRARAIRNMEKGYQRELVYRHPDGSYSAFGPESSETDSSIWLTSFVVKSFAQARTIIHIDERDLKTSVKWIVKKQLENGCFPLIGRVFHKEMKGGLEEEGHGDNLSPALTAYILVALLESGVPLTASFINNALHCLERGSPLTDDNKGVGLYTIILSTYALTLLDHPTADEKMKAILERATSHNGLLWWEEKSKASVVGLSIEMTAYAVLSLVKLGGEKNMVAALKAVRWMSKQRNSEGGFTSTQDTVVGLEALTKYAIAMTSNATDLSVLVTAEKIGRVYRMRNDNRMLLAQIQLPILPTVLDVFAEGEGCVLVQCTLRYNVAHATGSEAFELSVNAASVAASVDECSMQTITICARYKMADEESNMALLEIGMISGYVPERSSLHALLEDPLTMVKRFEEDRDTVTLYFDKLFGEKTCIAFVVTRENMVDRLEPANVKLYDYYQQELTISSSYSFAQMCSSADISEQPSAVPNPMPVEVTGTLLKGTSSSIEESFNFANGTTENSANASPFELGSGHLPEESFVHDTIGATIGIERFESDSADSSFNSDQENQFLDLSPTPTSSSSSSVSLLSSSSASPFVSVDHELETPDGIEGPAPVYMKIDRVRPLLSLAENPSDQQRFETTAAATAAAATAAATATEISSSGEAQKQSNNSPGPFTSTEMPTNHSSMERGDTNANSTLQSISMGTHSSCPTCDNVPPGDFAELYCRANSVVGVAIRRWRKARLLLDLHKSRPFGRLRSTVELLLNPGCSCPPLDDAGSIALILQAAEPGSESELTPLERQSKRVLDRSIHVYGFPPDPFSDIPSTSDVAPNLILDAYKFCLNRDRPEDAAQEVESTSQNDPPKA